MSYSVKRLREEVIRQICAGEVITRPVNCVKELIENSLDAGSTSIQITVKSGGLDSIKVKDNGKGISANDLQVVCERYTTSKLENFDDLSKIGSYGFRGEALYSISSIANLTIETKTAEDEVGHKVEYRSGAPVGGLKPIAANQGTVITVENLFYNHRLRKNMIKSKSAEYDLISSLVVKYAIHCSNSVAFTLRKNEKEIDVSTALHSQTMTNVGILCGKEVGKNIVAICCEGRDHLKFSMSGVISKPNVALKKFTFILFINERLVECSTLKKSIENVYSSHITKGFHPFVYLSLQLSPETIDVNIHPSKNEVRYLFEDDINSRIVDCINEKLSSLACHSNFEKSISESPVRAPPQSSAKKNNQSSHSHASRPQAAYTIIRTDARNRTLEEVCSQKMTSDKIGRNSVIRDIRLASVLRLRSKCQNEANSELTEILRNSEFVGCVDQWSFLMQSDNRLFLVNYEMLSEELFYQLYLKNFGNFGCICLLAPLSIEDLVKIYFKKHPFEAQSTLDAVTVKKLLVSKRDMLSDYFAIDINTNGQLITLPLITDGHLPDFSYLPDFIHSLSNKVKWTSEEECFYTLGRILATFYSRSPKQLSTEEYTEWKKTTEFVVYQKAKRVLKPPESLKAAFIPTTNLTDLFRVFERC